MTDKASSVERAESTPDQLADLTSDLTLSNNEGEVMSVTCTAPVNIAVVKYWGKRDEKLILPINGSISGTLHQDHLRAKTTVAASRNFKQDQMWLNGEVQSMDSARLQNVLKEIRRRARKRKTTDSQNDMLTWPVHICSENNFPTAAGLASSAAGYACLVFSLAKLFGVEGDISEIARQGSGSACRSVFGGFVEWEMGVEADGSDSIARQITSESHWAEMRIVVLVVSGKKKPIGSTAGMQTSIKTSELLQERIKQMNGRMDKMRTAIKAKDYPTFAELSMRDSNQMHAVCLDTYPPISYMNDTSRDIVRMVHAINAHYGEPRVCYTFDAGPNACLYVLDQNLPMVLGLVKHYFKPDTSGNHFIRGISVKDEEVEKDLLDKIPIEVKKGGLQYALVTKLGPGPRVLDDGESLLNDEGWPKSS